MKEIIIKIKLIYKARSAMKTDWKHNIKNYNFQISQKTVIHMITKYILVANSQEKKL